MKYGNNAENFINEALKYLSFGFSVIPIGDNKKPLIKWEPYQSKMATEEEIRQWFSSSNVTGIGIITGSLSKLLVMDAEKDADLSKIEIPTTITAKSGGGGYHFYFKYPQNTTIHNSVRKISPRIDIRAEGGYIIAPPSLHPSGNQYEWTKGCSPNEIEIAEMPESLLEKIRATNYEIKNWEGALEGVEEGRRNETATSIIGKLLQVFPEDQWEFFCWPLVRAWNENNKPPLSAKELRNVFHSIAEKEFGSRVSRESEQKDMDTKRERSKPLSVREVFQMALEPQPFLVEKLVPEKGMTAFSGYPESGKSWIILYVAHCIATGQQVFEKFAVKQGGVLIIDEEAGNAEFHKRMKMLGFNSEEKVYLYSQEEFKVDIRSDLKHLIDTAKNLDVKLVVFDPFSAIHSKTENSAEEMQRVMEALQQFNLAGIAVIFIHHHRKEHFMARNPQASIGLRGSTVLFARVDCHVAIKKDKETEEGFQMTLEQAKLRRDQKFKPFTVGLKINKETQTASFEYVGETKEEITKKEMAKEFIIEELQAKSPQTSGELIIKAKEGGIGKNAVEDALKEMRTENSVITNTMIGKGKALFYSLPQITTAEIFDTETEPVEQKLLSS